MYSALTYDIMKSYLKRTRDKNIDICIGDLLVGIIQHRDAFKAHFVKAWPILINV